MNRTHLLPAFILLSSSFAGYANTNKAGKAAVQALIEQCEICHAIEAKTASIAPQLDGMDAEHLLEQLDNFRKGQRGAGSTDPATQTMIAQVRALNGEQSQAIAEHYADRDRHYSTETVVGNTRNGKGLYSKHCAGCHSSSMGRFFTNSPQITHLDGPYLLVQLKLFAADQRGFVTQNKHKAKMIKLAKGFRDTELADIVAYMKTLSE
jgi:cytochrome c553